MRGIASAAQRTSATSGSQKPQDILDGRLNPARRQPAGACLLSRGIMKEADIITEAWAAQMRQAYAAFTQAWTAAADDAAKQAAAEEQFREAVNLAKKIKERALAVILAH